MSDRLGEIRKRNDPIFGGHWHSEELPIKQGDYIWLRDEVERLKTENDEFRLFIHSLRYAAPSGLTRMKVDSINLLKGDVKNE
ncbi:hypothetical protein [Sporolactobacillus terrae]|uniref:hypothetical protein n=1 Tax=Sporolactobacillus terrae TaxID=269673 RepID=UPI00048B3B4B|nr:hypothetical protein [Sporolactobacillus terrae]